MTDTASAAPSLLPCPFCGAAASGYAIEAHTHSAPLKSIGIPDHPGSYVIEGDCQCGSGLIGETQQEVTARWNRRAQPTPPAVVEPPELSPDFTDTARAALLWVLWHHQGGSSPVGQPIRFALGMGQHDRLNEHQLAEAKRWERLHPANPAVFPRGPEPLTDGLLQQHNRDSQELRRLCAARDQARSERDALKAEIAGLEASCSTLGRLVDELRPDAERLEWVLRRVSGTWLRAYLGVVSDTSDMDTLRTLIDANRGALTAHGIGIGVKKGESNGLPT